MSEETQAIDIADEAMVAQLRSVVRDVLKMEQRQDVDVDWISIDTPLSELPLDSLARLYMMNGIEEAYDVEISDETASTFTVVRSIVCFLRAQLGDSAGPGSVTVAASRQEAAPSPRRDVP